MSMEGMFRNLEEKITILIARISNKCRVTLSDDRVFESLANSTVSCMLNFCLFFNELTRTYVCQIQENTLEVEDIDE